MSVFVDTSAFLAVLNREDVHHPTAKVIWQRLLQHDEPLVCSNYVLVETLALLQNRLGMAAVRAFQQAVTPLLHIEWISPVAHHAAAAALLTANRRALSLVDCTSFEVMRAHGITQVFAFDPHFDEQGFERLGK